MHAMSLHHAKSLLDSRSLGLALALLLAGSLLSACESSGAKTADEPTRSGDVQAGPSGY